MTYQESITSLVEHLVGDVLRVENKTEAQAVALASTKPHTVFYTSDTHSIVVGGNVYGRGAEMAQVFKYASSAQDTSNWDTNYLYIVPESQQNYYIYAYTSSSWVVVGTERMDISQDAIDINYDATNSQLSADNVQDAIDELAENSSGNVDYDVISGANVQLKNENAEAIYPKTKLSLTDDTKEFGMVTEGTADFAISDARGNSIVEIKDGNIKTKNFDSASVALKLPYAHRTAFKVNVDATNYIKTNFTAEDINTYNAPTYYEDNCVLYLPTTYTPGGTPTKVIIYCKHGQSTITESTDDLFTATGNMGKIIPYLVSLGYAVLGADGLPDGWATALGLCERVVGNYVAVQSAIKAWEYATANYNLDKSMAFIFGYSQGGHYAQNVIDNSNIPVAACAELSPVCSFRWHQWDLATPVTVGGVSFTKGARLNVARIFDYPAVSNDTELNALTYDASKVQGFDPWTRNVEDPYNNFASGPIWSLPSGTTLDDITMKKHIRCPLKIWCANNDNTLSPTVMKVFIKAIKNAGQNADIQVYSTGAHQIPNTQTASGTFVQNGTTYNLYPIAKDIADWYRINGGY